MEKLTSAARKIDVVFKIIDIFLMIACVACLVCVIIVIAAGVFDLPDDMIGTVTPQLTFGGLTIHIADGYGAEFSSMLLQNALMCVLTAVICFVTHLGVKTIRAILAPMKEGQPFHSDVSRNLRKLGWLGLAIGLMVQALEAFILLTASAAMQLETLLISEKITRVDVGFSLDLTVVLIPAVFFLLAYVFNYGEQLQQLSDETL